MAEILIAEDDADSRDALAKLLEIEGYRVVCAANGKDAFKAVLTHLPDLIVLDLFMPDVDGALFLETIRSYLRFSNLPVVIWTGHPDSPLATLARSLKVRSVVAKGLPSYDEILTAIHKALNGKAHKKDSN
jgi:CheY-like chemotaxis protein